MQIEDIIMRCFILALLSVSVGSGYMPETPIGLLDPLDPALGAHAQAPRAPTRGLKPFAPVEPKDWQQMNQKVTPSEKRGSDPGMPSMPGMGDMK